MKNLATLFVFTLFCINFTFSQDLVLEWATQIKGDGSHRHASITTDSEGNVITAGIFKGNTDFDPSGAVFNLASIGNQRDIFIQKLDNDRNLLWAISLGSTGVDDVYEVTTDQFDNIYIAGNFLGTIDADPSTDEFILSSNSGNSDGLLLKLDKDGNFIWATSYGPGGWNRAYTVLVNAENEVYVIGGFTGQVDFDSGPDFHIVNSQGQYDGFITKLDEDGNFLWMKDIGGPSSIIEVWSSALDPDGNIVSTGGYAGNIDFDPGPEVAELTSIGEHDAFAFKLDADGNYLWANSIGSIGMDYSNHITTDQDGDIIMTGRFSETCDFDPTTSTDEITSNGQYDAFVLKLNPQGERIWTKTIGGIRDELSYSILTDNEKNIYLTGFFEHVVNFDQEGTGFNLHSGGNTDTYIYKINKDADLIWAKSFGGPDNVYGHAATFDIYGNIFVTGSFEEPSDVHPEPTAMFQLEPIGNTDNYIIKLSPAPVSISSTILENEITIFPNPTLGQINIDPGSYNNNTITIFNILGQQIFAEHNVSNSLQIDIEHDAGIYFIEIENETGKLTSKIIKN